MWLPRSLPSSPPPLCSDRISLCAYDANCRGPGYKFLGPPLTPLVPTSIPPSKFSTHTRISILSFPSLLSSLTMLRLSVYALAAASSLASTAFGRIQQLYVPSTVAAGSDVEVMLGSAGYIQSVRQCHMSCCRQNKLTTVFRSLTSLPLTVLELTSIPTPLEGSLTRTSSARTSLTRYVYHCVHFYLHQS